MASDYIGIDFGTSNCAVAAWDQQGPVLIPVDPREADPYRLRSAAFVAHLDQPLPAPREGDVYRKLTALKGDLSRQIHDLEAAQSQYRPGSRDFRHFEQGIARLREQRRNEAWLQTKAHRLAMQDMQQQEQTLDDMLTASTITFGEAGFRTFLETPEEGRFVTSPKNFLGADIPKRHLETFEMLVGRFLAHLRRQAEQQLGRTVRKAAIGRPVQYHSTQGDKGNGQAIGLMERAAAWAGFDDVVFVPEPLAAAYHFERKLAGPTRAMIVDLGGGTSDVTVCELSADKVDSLEREQDILSVKGIRQGGIICDKRLGTHSVAPAFGRGSLTRSGRMVPHGIYEGFLDIDDLQASQAFFSDRRLDEIEHFARQAVQPEHFSRLQRVQEERLSHRLMYGIEQAKIALSEQADFTLPLDYIESDFTVPMNRTSMEAAMQPWLENLYQLMTDSQATAGRAPEVVFVTGGMGLSPVVQQAIASHYPGVEIRTADAFSSVASGAAIHAHRLFG